jgi:hypothetical protein
VDSFTPIAVVTSSHSSASHSSQNPARVDIGFSVCVDPKAKQKKVERSRAFESQKSVGKQGTGDSSIERKLQDPSQV